MTTLEVFVDRAEDPLLLGDEPRPSGSVVTAR